MPKWRFWEKEPTREQTSALPGRTATAGEPIVPNLAPRRSEPASPDHIAALKRRRDGILFDVEQSELAHQDENPWRERITLLEETVADIRAERARLDDIPRLDLPAPPELPVSLGEVRWQDPALVEITIGDQRFRFESDLDWAERGTYVSRNDLERRGGDAAAIAPTEWEDDTRQRFTDRLNESLFILASDLRNRAENGEALPTVSALHELISPCPDCGDWKLWGGFCPRCAERAQQAKALDDEILGRLGEIAGEEEERATIAERLPVALRRLADVEAELDSLGVTQ